MDLLATQTGTKQSGTNQRNDQMYHKDNKISKVSKDKSFTGNDYNANNMSSRRKSSTKEVVLGEVFLGTSVPDVDCKELWVQVLMNSRSVVQKWLTII